jgi:hypothetical protein
MERTGREAREGRAFSSSTDSRAEGARRGTDQAPIGLRSVPIPLADGVDVRRLSQAFAKSRRAVKEILMDQRVLVSGPPEHGVMGGQLTLAGFPGMWNVSSA